MDANERGLDRGPWTVIVWCWSASVVLGFLALYLGGGVVERALGETARSLPLVTVALLRYRLVVLILGGALVCALSAAVTVRPVARVGLAWIYGLGMALMSGGISIWAVAAFAHFASGPGQ